jgi:SAM-dependent methyltransferase
LAVAKSGQGKRWGLGRLADPKRRRKWIRDEAQRLKIRAQQRLNRQAPDIYSIAANAIQAGDKVCDFGCGSPRFLSKIQELVGGIRLTGVDFVEHDARAFEAIGASFMPADKFWDSDETYGLINMNHVLEHIPDPDAFLLRIRGKLAPGGYLLIATPNAQSLWAKIFSRCWFALDCPRHINIPSLSSLLTITGRLNYKVEISALQFKYNDFSRSLLSLQCEQSSSSYQERLESLYGSKDSIKLQRAKQKELAFLKDLFMIRLWFIGSAVSRLWEGSDRIILLLSSKDFS